MMTNSIEKSTKIRECVNHKMIISKKSYTALLRYLGLDLHFLHLQFILKRLSCPHAIPKIYQHEKIQRRNPNVNLRRFISVDVRVFQLLAHFNQKHLHLLLRPRLRLPEVSEEPHRPTF